MRLQVILNRNAIDLQPRREVVSGPEQGLHRHDRVTPARRRPVVLRAAVLGRISADFLGFIHPQPDGLRGPIGRAVSAERPGPKVLMQVDIDLDPMLARATDQGVQVVQIGAVVSPWAGVLDGLPRHDQALDREPPALQAPKVLVGVGEREGPADETDGAGIRCRNPRRLARASEIDAAQDQRASLRILEGGAVHADGLGLSLDARGEGKRSDGDRKCSHDSVPFRSSFALRRLARLRRVVRRDRRSFDAPTRAGSS